MWVGFPDVGLDKSPSVKGARDTMGFLLVKGRQEDGDESLGAAS